MLQFVIFFGLASKERPEPTSGKTGRANVRIKNPSASLEFLWVPWALCNGASRTSARKLRKKHIQVAAEINFKVPQASTLKFLQLIPVITLDPVALTWVKTNG